MWTKRCPDEELAEIRKPKESDLKSIEKLSMLFRPLWETMFPSPPPKEEAAPTHNRDRTQARTSTQRRHRPDRSRTGGIQVSAAQADMIEDHPSSMTSRDTGAKNCDTREV